MGRIALIFVLFATGAARGQSLPASAYKTEQFPLPSSLKGYPISRLIYGNDKYGHFALKADVVNGSAVFKFFPPGYREPIRFFAEAGAKTVLLGQRSYTSPFAQFPVQRTLRSRGNLTTPFFMLALPVELKHGRSFPAVINSRGEIVWTAAEAAGNLPQKIGGTEMLALESDSAGTKLAVRDMVSGSAIRSVTEPRHALHHMIQYLPESEEVLSLAYDCHSVGWWEEFSPVFQGFKGFLNWLRLPGRTYAGSRIVRTNLITGESRAVWSTHHAFSTASSPNLTLLAEMDLFLDIREPAEYLKALAIPKVERLNFSKCDADWSHENSVRYYPDEGYLVSLRNFNKIIMVGEDGRVKWSMGGGSENQFRTLEDEGFSMQHDATLLPGRRVLMYNNNLPYRGNLRPSGKNKAAIYRLENGSAKLDWEMELPGPPSLRRGSVSMTESGRVVAFSAGSHKTAARIFEIDPKTKEVTGSIAMFAGSSQDTLEARPLNSILHEIMVKPPQGGRPLLMSRRGGPDFASGFDATDLQISDQGY